MKLEYNIKDIPKNIKIRKGYINLVYTNHALQRFEERNLDKYKEYPKCINLSKSIKKVFVKDNKITYLCSMKFKKHKNIRLNLIITNLGIVKTLFFDKK